MSLLSLEGVTAARGGRRVLDGVSLAVAPGEVVGLLGPNGAGKSTLMRVAAGLAPATGAVRLGDAALAGLDARARALRVAYLPQEREVAWPVTVATLVGLGRLPHRAGAAADQAAVARAIAAMDLGGFEQRPATELSGGERARALIARALAQEAPLLLADEPAAGLDPAHQIGLMARLADLAREGRGVLVALHDLGLAARWCDRVALLHRGRIVAVGPPGAVLTAERLAEVYGILAHLDRDAAGPILLPVGLAPPPPRGGA
ncbi:ABC transporter ATP-binding protein [Amaricoccus sp.]|uniref:ABC transporter ATP-binding protein n=1 Tax=Amaricoccus sp. TaxID=1872485 RepID=UPI001B5DAE8C|nr:ABC transporter ATP-binding protein [Amaricoccus sp.]MBP7003268.1 ABC transporter ATP-binding protein [Amaricoccus sp.]